MTDWDHREHRDSRDSRDGRDDLDDTIDRASGYTVDCASCVMRGTVACDDCIVSFIVKRDPGDALVIDVAEERAVRWFQEAGLVPSLRHVSRL